MPLPQLDWISCQQRRPLASQIVISQNAIREIRMRIKPRIEKSDSHTSALIFRVSIEPHRRRDNGEPIRRVLMIVIHIVRKLMPSRHISST